MSTARFTLILVLLNLVLSGCSSSQRQEDSARKPSELRTYSATGIVREISVDRRTARIAHEAIPGFMPKMTMNFTVMEPSELEFIAIGDQVQFDLKVTEDDHWILNVKKVGQTTVPNSNPDPSTLVAPKEVHEGELLPDQILLKEDGNKVRLNEFQGRPVAITFIFTRCPLPNFCPRMSTHFRDAQALIQSKPWPADRPPPALLSLSFDPDYDTPARLRRYASVYRTDSQTNWIFASIPKTNLLDFTSRCGLELDFEGGSIGHNLRTLVIAPNGVIKKIFKGNEWTVDQLYEALLSSSSMMGKPGSP